MIRNTGQVEKINDKFYYGWIIVFVSALTAFFSGPGQTYFISGFIDSYIKDFNISRMVISQYYSMATLSAGLLLFIVGRYIDKYGQKRITIIIASLLAITCIFTGLMSNAFMLIISFFFLRLLGQGSMTMLPNITVPKWFSKNRGFALSMISVGSVLGSTVIPPLNDYIVRTYSWNSAWFLWASLLIIILVPLVFLFLINEPSDIGLEIDNQRKDKKTKKLSSWGLNQAIKTRTFWYIAISSAIPAFINTGLFFHLYSIIKMKGLNSTHAALVLSLYGGLSFLFSMIAGYVLDRVKIKSVLVIAFIFQFLNIILLLNISNVYMAIIFGINLGVIGGFQRVSRKLIWPNYYGEENLGSISGFSMTSLVIASSISPIIIGTAYEFFGNYDKILLLISIIPLIGAIMIKLSKKPVINR